MTPGDSVRHYGARPFNRASLESLFAIDIESCRRCGGKLRVIASIEDPALIERILAHLEPPPAGDPPRSAFTPRAPPPPLPLG